jgi:uncharacterized protein (UPF0335 family)
MTESKDINQSPANFKQRVTLKHAWIIYFIGLPIYGVSAYIVRNNLYTSLGTTTMTILVLYLIMMQSNKEMRAALGQEAKTFAENLESVTNELRKVSEALSDVKERIGTMGQDTKNLVAIEKTRDEERVQRLRPRLVVTFKSDHFALFFLHYYLIVVNNGSVAKDVQISYLMGKVWKNNTYPTIPRNGQAVIDCGDVTLFTSISLLQVWASVYDEEGNHYVGTINVDVKNTKSQEIPLSLQPSGS